MASTWLGEIFLEGLIPSLCMRESCNIGNYWKRDLLHIFLFFSFLFLSLAFPSRTCETFNVPRLETPQLCPVLGSIVPRFQLLSNPILTSARVCRSLLRSFRLFSFFLFCRFCLRPIRLFPPSFYGKQQTPVDENPHWPPLSWPVLAMPVIVRLDLHGGFSLIVTFFSP